MYKSLNSVLFFTAGGTFIKGNENVVGSLVDAQVPALVDANVLNSVNGVANNPSGSSGGSSLLAGNNVSNKISRKSCW